MRRGSDALGNLAPSCPATGRRLQYKFIGESGPAHTPTFTAVVFVDGLKVGRGQGPSKKAAESEAAQDALVRLGVDDAPLDADAEMHLR